MNESKPRRLWRNLLIDRRFQLKYTLAVVVISAVISVILGAFLYGTQQEVFEANRENSLLLAMDDPEMNKAIQEALDRDDRKIQRRNSELMLLLVVSLGGLVLVLTLLGILATHKIAGPAYAMRRIMSQIADGRHPRVRKLRRGDELRAVAEELRRMADKLREREEREVTGLREALEKLKAAGQAPGEVAAWMEETIAEKEQRLGPDA